MILSQLAGIAPMPFSDGDNFKGLRDYAEQLITGDEDSINQLRMIARCMLAFPKETCEHPETVEIFVDQKANVQLQKEFFTCIEVECFKGKVEKEILEILKTKFNKSGRTINHNTAVYWITRFRDRQERAIFEQALIKYIEIIKIKENEDPQREVALPDVYQLYTCALDAHLFGRYREAFALLKPTMPFLATSPILWIRITEACICEFYEETFMFTDTYERLFFNKPRINELSNRRSFNEMRPRHPDMTPHYAESAACMALTMAKCSKNPVIQYSAAQNFAFMMLKLRKYRDALDIIQWIVVTIGNRALPMAQMSILLLYKAEAHYYLGDYSKAIETAIRVTKHYEFPTFRSRALMILAMSYIKRMNYKKAYEYIMETLDVQDLCVPMLENVALLGVHLSYVMNNIPMLQVFLENCSKFVSSADVVICGGGISGTSLAYHLAKRGKKVCLFERDSVGCQGATGLSAGLVSAPIFWQDANIQTVAQESLKLYSNLAQTCKFRYVKCGRTYFASTMSNEILLRRMYSRGIVQNDNVELIDCQSEMLARWPFLETEDIQLALFSPEDVALDAVALSQQLAEVAKEHGAKIFENCPVTDVHLGDERQVYGVDTKNGFVETSHFVDAAGIWAGTVLCKSLPHQHIQTATYPCTYTYIHTSKLPTGAVSDLTPIFNDLDGNVMMRATSFKTLCAGFAEQSIRPLARQSDNTTPWHQPEPDWAKFDKNLEKLIHRCGMLGEVNHGDLICGMESYTPDKLPTIGESSQAKGYYVMCGMNGQGLSLAGGLAKLLSEIICDGVAKTADVTRVDVGRFIDLHANSQYLIERTPEIAAQTYMNLYSSHQCHTARNLRMAPIYHQLRDAGAVFGEIMGYERPLWFEKSPKPGRNALLQGQDALIGKPEWFDRVSSEYEACRERVGLIDMSSFSKYDITGPDSVKFLQYLCSANVDEPVGTTVYTGMQHKMGGYVTDCTLSRLGENKFFMVAPTIQQERCLVWMKKWIDRMGVKVHVQDVTGAYTALDLIGPSSRYLMSDVTGLAMSTAEFPTFRCQEINIGMATGIRAISVTHCGELGWVIYIPNEVAQNVYEKVLDAGQEYSLQHAGYYTLRQLRIEKFYVYWGQDINATVTPVECGRMFRVDFKKDFIGKQALLEQVEKGVSKRFVQLLIDSHDKETDPWPQGGETLYRDGRPCGLTTSAAYGFTLGCQVCIAFIENKEFGVSADFINRGTYELDIAGKRFPCRVNLHSPTLPMISSEHPLHYRPTQ
ncbi:unnamed protein product [Caenorhabditis bovis]|uniref:FAD-dependent oxidoreductase n=1 Tax=Caenorhabditis bovis TaxID=2654633 RepID=A0A8S1EX70_9PELO|nr:unnamed protein product [Caenorhabditis bovis]